MAFGTPDAPVTIRCGLTPPPPTTDRCLSVSKTDEDAGVDWINPEAGSPLLPEHAPSDAWVFLTYGRTPALEVVIPVESGIAQPTAALLAVEPAATLVEAERTCVGATDLIGED